MQFTQKPQSPARPVCSRRADCESNRENTNETHRRKSKPPLWAQSYGTEPVNDGALSTVDLING